MWYRRLYHNPQTTTPTERHSGSAGRQLVRQDVAVSRHHRVADLNRSVLGVIGHTDQDEDRHTRRELQRTSLLGERHPRSHILCKALEPMAHLLQASIDAPRASIGLGDLGALDQLPGKVGRRDLHRLAVRQIAPSPSQYLTALLDL